MRPIRDSRSRLEGGSDEVAPLRIGNNGVGAHPGRTSSSLRPRISFRYTHAFTTASAEMKFIGGLSLAATFEGEFSDVTRSYAGKGTVRYAW